MADLNVQPKKRAPVWPWILLLLVIAVAAYFFLRDKDVATDGTGSDSTSLHQSDTLIQYPTDTASQYRTDTVRTDTGGR